jgi:hypothetical protein
MEIVRVEKNKDFVVVKNTIFRNKEISLKTKGMYALLMSLSGQWDFSIAGITSICKEGKESIYGSIKELETFGYCKKTKVRDSLGKIIKTEYVFFEEPINSDFNPQTDLPETDNPETGNPFTENPTQYNTNSNKEENNKNEIDFDGLMKYYNYAFGKQMKVVNDKCKRQFKRLLKLTYTKADIKKVIDNASNDKFHEENDFKHLTLEFISRQEKFEKYFAMPHQKPRCEQIKKNGHINH